mgnify:FL=1
MAYAIIVKENKVCVITDQLARTSAALGAGTGYDAKHVQRAGEVYLLPLLPQNTPPWVFVRDRLAKQEETDAVYYKYLRATGGWKRAAEFGGSDLALLDTYIYELGTARELYDNATYQLFDRVQADNEPIILSSIPEGMYFAKIGMHYYYIGTWGRAINVQVEMEAVGAQKIWVSENIAIYRSSDFIADDTYTEDASLVRTVLRAVFYKSKKEE